MFTKKTGANLLAKAGTILIALLFVFQYNLDARQMNCTYKIENGHIVIHCEGDLEFQDAVDLSPTQKQAEITGFVGQSSLGTYTLDDNYDSQAILTSKSSSGVPFYPATAVVNIHVKFEDNAGDIWTTTEVCEFVLMEEADSFPPQDAWKTRLSTPVAFVRGQESFTLESSDAVVQP